MKKQKTEKKIQKTASAQREDAAVNGSDKREAVDGDVEEVEVVDVGDTALIAIENDVGTSTTVIRPQPALQLGNTRRRIEDYMEMKRAARELHDLDDFDFDPEH
ncbi:MAG: PA3496 family putative envelope integrity protein [Gammaproteobacteria bacterium]